MVKIQNKQKPKNIVRLIVCGFIVPIEVYDRYGQSYLIVLYAFLCICMHVLYV